MIPDKSNPCWRQLALGKTPIHTEFLGLQMILKRQQRHLRGGANEAALQTAVDELYAFFVKYQAVLVREIQSL